MSELKTAVILLAGGKGSRFGGPVPKQYLQLGDQPLILHSFEVLSRLPSLTELIVVCDEAYRHYFPTNTLFAPPGPRRQDSVYNGLRALQTQADYVCVHDGARPFITLELVTRVLHSAQSYGAATAGMPLKFTVKEHDGNLVVKHTPDRSKLWEIQTPQIIKRTWLEEGFAHVNGENLTVTDDVSIVERLGYPVKLVEGSYDNLKITSVEDLSIASHLFESVHG